MAQTFYFYDLETSGFNPRVDRIMQFAGQRTDMDLNPIGEADNILIRLTSDTVPDPGAILVTGITPQKTLDEGISEAEFAAYFSEQVATADTIIVGFNNVRFDDEFIRYLLWRNFYDPYEWAWKDGRSRWDLLDMVRMTRALRPQGIKWPYGPNGEPSNKLELLSSVNELDHEQAHDALSDVVACIALARLIKEKQPKLFDYLLSHRDKKLVQGLVEARKPLVYCSGRYDNQYEKTTVVIAIADHPQKQGSFVYDLRFDPQPFLKMTPAQLAEAWRYRTKDEPAADKPLPVKLLQYNRCPAIAPLSVLDEASQICIKIDLKTIQANAATLAEHPEFAKAIVSAFKLMEKNRKPYPEAAPPSPDAQLYDGFVSDGDKIEQRMIVAASPQELETIRPQFHDQRLIAMFPLYKARNFPKILSDEDRATWEAYRKEHLLGGNEQSLLARFYAKLQQFASEEPDKEKAYLLEELRLYAESITPEE